MSFYVLFSSFLSGMLCSMGFGSGTVLIIFLTNMLNFKQTAAQGINLLFFIPCASYALINYIKKGLVEKSRVIPLVFGGIIGIVFGYMLLSHIPTQYLSKLFGGFVIILGLKQLMNNKKNS